MSTTPLDQSAEGLDGVAQRPHLMLLANHIDDPRKLQIGQKLIVPSKAAKTKKSNE